MKKIILFPIFVLMAGFLFGQDEAIYTHYIINPLLVNPAHAGFPENHRVQMNVRSQWVGFPGSPRTYGITYGGPIGKTLGLGLAVHSDNVAALSKYRIQMNYAFRYTINDFKIAGGFSTEFQNTRLASAGLTNEQIFDQDDQLIDQAVNGIRVFDASLGFFGTYKERTFAGVSFPNLVSARLDDIVTESQGGSLFKDFVFMLGHDFEVDQYDFTIQPSIMMMNVRDVPFGLDFNLKATFLDRKLTAGLLYHAGRLNGLGVLLGTKLQIFELYYSYDVSFQQFQSYNGGSHEVTIGFDFEAARRNQGRRLRQ